MFDLNQQNKCHASIGAVRAGMPSFERGQRLQAGGHKV